MSGHAMFYHGQRNKNIPRQAQTKTVHNQQGGTIKVPKRMLSTEEERADHESTKRN